MCWSRDADCVWRSTRNWKDDAGSVNSLAVTRDAWIEVAKTTGTPFVEIEVICSDSVEHRRRVELRKPDIPGHKLPSWQDVLDRQYDPWTREHIVVDTATLSIVQAVDDVIEQLSMMSMHPSPGHRKMRP